MKKMTLLITLASFVILLLPKNFSAADLNSEQRSTFSRSLEEHNQNMVNNYHDHSTVILDSMIDRVTVTKILSTDDPKTPENEEKIQEYESNVITAFVQYQKQRDSIFYIEKTDMIFYDIEKNEFLLSGNVLANDSVKTFFQNYAKDLKSEITPLSITIFMILISALLAIPVSIMIFGEKGRNHVHAEERSRYSSSI